MPRKAAPKTVAAPPSDDNDGSIVRCPPKRAPRKRAPVKPSADNIGHKPTAKTRNCDDQEDGQNPDAADATTKDSADHSTDPDGDEDAGDAGEGPNGEALGVRHPLFLMRKRWLKHARQTPMFLCEPLKTVDGKPMYMVVPPTPGRSPSAANFGATKRPTTEPAARPVCIGAEDAGTIKPLWTLQPPSLASQRFYTIQDFAVEECVRLREKRSLRGSTKTKSK